MRLFGGVLALVAVAAAGNTPLPVVGDAGESTQSVMAKKAAEEFVATPIQEFMKDMYELFVRQGGSRFFRRLRYMTAGVGATRSVLTLSDEVMEYLRNKIFNGSVNTRMWRALRMELYFLLLDWWVSTPENPVEAADLGVWHSLVQLQKDFLGPALRGSSRVDQINAMLLDPDLKDIKVIVQEWRHKTQKAQTQASKAVEGPAETATEPESAA